MRATKSNSPLAWIRIAGLCAMASFPFLTGCERGRDRDEQKESRADRSAPSAQDAKVSRKHSGRLSIDEGEELPLPADANRALAQRQPKSNMTTQNGSGGGGKKSEADDGAIFILAGLAQEHDQFKKRLHEMEQRQGEFLPVQEQHDKAIKQLSNVQVPKLEQQMAAQQNETAKLGVEQSAMEKRIAALEAEVKSLRGGKTTPPAVGAAPEIEPDVIPLEVGPTNVLPQPVVSPSLTLDKQEPPAETQIIVKSGDKKNTSKVATPSKDASQSEPKKVAKFTPQQQAIRSKVRGIYERVNTDFPGTQQAFDALMSLGAMAEEEEDWPAAIRVYERAATEYDNRPEVSNARFNLGRALASNGSFAQARDAFLIIPDTNPKDPLATSALLQAAICYAKAGKLDSGLNELRHIEKIDSESAFAQTAREESIQLLFDAKRYEDVLARYPEVMNVARPLRRMDLLMMKARSERAAKRYKEARATLEGMFQDTASPEMRAAAKYEYADLFFEQDKPLEAARAMSDAAQEFPKNARMPEARMKAAQLYLSSEMPETATEQMQAMLKALAEWPKDELEKTEPEALFVLAKAQQNNGQLDAAAKSLAELKKKYPDHPRSLGVDLEEARGLAERGAVKDATALLRVMIKNHPNAPQSAQAMLMLAELQERNTDRLQRANAFADLLKQTAGNDDANTNELRRGLLLMELERYDEAATTFKKIADNARAQSDLKLIARYQAAIAQQQAGQLDAAIKSYGLFIESSATVPEPAPKNLPALVDDAKWKMDKLKWLKELTAPAKPVPAQAASAQTL